MLADLCLVGEDLVPDLLPRIAHVGSISEHYLVYDDSKCKEIRLKGVIHPANDLRSHIARRSTGLLGVVLLLPAGHPEISDPEIPALLEDQILRLEVAMDDAPGVGVLQPKDNATRDELCIIIRLLVCSSLKAS